MLIGLGEGRINCVLTANAVVEKVEEVKEEEMAVKPVAARAAAGAMLQLQRRGFRTFPGPKPLQASYNLIVPSYILRVVQRS